MGSVGVAHTRRLLACLKWVMSAIVLHVDSKGLNVAAPDLHAVVFSSVIGGASGPAARKYEKRNQAKSSKSI